MTKFVWYIILFGALNFGALALGSWLMNGGPVSSWYMELEKAPWTPPGWMFGLAWTTIMCCFTIYMARLVQRSKDKWLWPLYGIQLFLNIIWNYVFFNLRQVGLALLLLILLTIIVWLFFFRFRDKMKNWSWLLAPYMIWLVLATSLNAYIYFANPI